jgi:hypothetical protein
MLVPSVLDFCATTTLAEFRDDLLDQEISHTYSQAVTRQEGTSRHCGLNTNPLRVVNDWFRDYEVFWGVPMQGWLEAHLRPDSVSAFD